MISRSSDFVRRRLIAKLSSMKKTAIFPFLRFSRDLSAKSSLITLSLERKRMESPKKPVTVQNSQPYGQPRPDSTGIMRNEPHPPPNLLSIGVKTLGIKLNCLRLIESHGIAGYAWSDGLRSFPALSTGA